MIIIKNYIFLVLTFVLIGTSNATPFTWGDKIVKPLAWDKNSTINVFIQQDPTKKGRDALLKEGVERWTKKLADRMITLNVTIGNPKPTDTNVVRYTFQPDGFSSGKRVLGAHKNDGIGTAISDGTKLIGGEAFIRSKLAANTIAEKVFLKNLGEHELTHVLGLADDAKGSITNHIQPSTARAENTQDTKEINTLYGTVNAGGVKKPRAAVKKTGGGANKGYLKYTFDFRPANNTPDPNDPEHVSLITIDIDPNLVTGFDLPDGWIGLDPTITTLFDDPFFSEGYMIDGAGDIAPWSSSDPISFLAFRTSVQQAEIDGLLPEFDPALSLVNTQLDFTIFIKDNLSEQIIDVWAGDELQVVMGVTAPEPTTLTLLSLGLAVFGFSTKRMLS